MTEKDFFPAFLEKYPASGEATWMAPSNIALVKYWGKKPEQIPTNASLSFTLHACSTTTTVLYEPLAEETGDFSFNLLVDGKPNKDFRPKIQTFFTRIERYLPFLKKYHLRIETSNTFPHSSGIASSASGMAALALCVMEMEKELYPEMNESYFVKKASFLARLGSGSACRSIEGEVMEWGSHPSVEGSSDLYGIPYPYKVHNIFKHYQDTILLVHKGRKHVSSTAGHNLMRNHPFALRRFEQANDNLQRLKGILETGDLQGFVQIVENEALSLHAMMLTSDPYFILMKPNTLGIIERIRAFRKKSGTQLCFTLDAGANVHVLYPENEKEIVFQFIQDELVAFCEKGQYICDQIGVGAKKG